MLAYNVGGKIFKCIKFFIYRWKTIKILLLWEKSRLNEINATKISDPILHWNRDSVFTFSFFLKYHTSPLYNYIIVF